MLPQASADHYRTQQRLVLAALGLTRREWAGMGADWDASWERLGPRVTLVTASAQLGAARSSAAYVPAVLEELGTPVAPAGEVVPAAFSGFASDGRPLGSLLAQAVIRAKVARSNGLPAQQSLAVGGRALESYVHTQIVDAGRGAASVGIAARPKVGWVRMVSAPCCDRCAILAGKWFKYNDGFERHPQCSCTHIPSTEDTGEDVGTSPEELFSGGHVRGLTTGQQAALDEGAAPARVVNATGRRSGMATASAGAKGVRRLTPDHIYRMGASREQTLELLRRNGYLA